MQLSQIFLGLGLIPVALADISSKCDRKTARIDKLSSSQPPSYFDIVCDGSRRAQHLDLNKCFLNQNGLHYFKDGNGFKTYVVDEDNKEKTLDLVVKSLELNKDGKPSCFGYGPESSM